MGQGKRVGQGFRRPEVLERGRIEPRVRRSRRINPNNIIVRYPVIQIETAKGEDLIVRLRARLADLGAPVEARGVLLTEWLVGDVTSPLYDRSRTETLPRALARTIAALEPHG